MIEQLKGQMSITDCFGPDIWSGKTCPEPLAQTKAKTSEPSSKKQRKSSVKMPLFLDLRAANGVQAAASWVMGGALLGEYTMHSFGECPSEENASLLSQILEENPLPKYSLSVRACAGILRRAEKRGKKLPELLEETLKRQSAFKSEPDAMEGARESSYSMSEQEPCQQSIINRCYSIDEKMGQTYVHEEQGNTLGARDYKQPQAVVCEAGGTLRAQEHGHQPIVFVVDCYNQTQSEEVTQPLRSINADADHIPCVYGIDRASFNQGQNAQYDFSVTEEQAQTLVAKGPGGVLATNQAIGEYKITGVASSLKQRDYKDATDLVISQTTGESVNNGK